MNTKVVNAAGVEQEGGYFINSWNLMPDWEAEGEHGLHGLYERSRLTACRGAGVTSMYDVH